MTSHAAVVARGMGTCCVSGCGDIVMDEENKKFTLAGKEFHEGDAISLDGSTGNIYDGIIPTVDATIAGEFGRIMAWADKYRTMGVRTNADTPSDAKKARELGAEGIGLCRTEHMFFEGKDVYKRQSKQFLVIFAIIHHFLHQSHHPHHLLVLFQYHQNLLLYLNLFRNILQ